MSLIWPYTLFQNGRLENRRLQQLAKWLFDGNKICLAGIDGQRVYPNALQMYSAVFDGPREIDGLTPGNHPLDDLKEINFSRYPAEPAIRIAGSSPDQIMTSIGVKTDIGFIPIPGSEDQVIASGKWYPIDSSSIEHARSWLLERDITEESPIRLGQLIELRCIKEAPYPIFDNTNIKPINIAETAGKDIIGISGLNGTLYPYQRDGIAFLELISQQNIGCILADEMGLGKTLQIIGLLQSEKNAGRAPSLVIAPATIVENWRRELTEFAPRLKVLSHTGNDRAGISQRLSTYDVIITSFETAVRDESLLNCIKWNILVLDEAQAIKNPDALRTKTVKQLHRRVSVAVTGTPVENRLEDLWSISDFALPGLLGTLDNFRGKFADDIKDAGQLGPIVAPILLRRRVAEVAKDLPEKLEIPQPITMSLKLAETYETLRRETLAEYDASAGLVSATRLRLLCTHPSLITPWDSDPSHEMPKYQRLLEILAEIFESNEKALIFTTYQGMSDLLMKDITRRWSSGFFKHIDGRVPVPERQPIVDEFYNHKGFGALFLNPKAAGAGLNITAANHVVHYNPEWNPALTDQASRRSFRRKQKLPVTIHHLYYADSIEEAIIQRASLKREIAEEAIIGNDGNVDSFTIFKALQISPLSKLSGIKK